MTDTVATPRLLIGFDLSKAGQWGSENKDTGKVQHNFQWTQEQWRHIEIVAFKLLLATMRGNAEWRTWDEAITPEALDFWDEDLPEGLFDDDEVSETNGIAGCSTAIGVVDAILEQFEEEIGKRGGSLP